MKKLPHLLLAFVVFYFAYDWLLAHYLPQSHVWPRVVLPSLFMLLPFSMFFGLFYNFKRYRVIQGSDTAAPKDGKWVALSGTVIPGDESLVSPFTRKDCVCYSYCVSSYGFSSAVSKSIGRGEMAWHRRYFGYARVPWVLRSSIANIQMKTFFGTSSHVRKHPPEEEVVANARQFVDRTSFEKRTILGTELLEFPPKDSRKDWISTLGDAVPDLKECQLEEDTLPVGQVCLVSGIWSDQTQGLTIDVTLYPGVKKDVLSGIRRQIITQIIMIPFLTAFINFAFYNLYMYS